MPKGGNIIVILIHSGSSSLGLNYPSVHIRVLPSPFECVNVQFLHILTPFVRLSFVSLDLLHQMCQLSDLDCNLDLLFFS
jgi:hypothetical protein